MSELQLELAQESARSSKISLYNQVTKAYYAILLSQDSYNVMKRSYENSKENARIIYNKYKQGSVSEFEWIRADVQERNALTNVVSTENAVNLSKLQLKMLMGIDMYIEIAVEGRLSDFEAKMYSDVLKIDTTTLNKNSDLKQFDIQKKQLEQTEKIQRASLLPTLGASINYQYMSMVNDSITFTNQHIWFPTSTFGLQLSIPLFQGGTKYNKIKQIKIQREEMELQRDNLKRSLELQTISQMNNIKNALKKSNRTKKACVRLKKVYLFHKNVRSGYGNFPRFK